LFQSFNQRQDKLQYFFNFFDTYRLIEGFSVMLLLAID